MISKNLKNEVSEIGCFSDLLGAILCKYDNESNIFILGKNNFAIGRANESNKKSRFYNGNKVSENFKSFVMTKRLIPNFPINIYYYIINNDTDAGYLRSEYYFAHIILCEIFSDIQRITRIIYNHLSKRSSIDIPIVNIDAVKSKFETIYLLIENISAQISAIESSLFSQICNDIYTVLILLIRLFGARSVLNSSVVMYAHHFRLLSKLIY